MRKKKLLKKFSNGTKPVFCLDEITVATHCYVCGRHFLISCISFSSQLTKSQDNHATSCNFHSILFPLSSVPSVVIIQICLSWKQAEKCALVCYVTFGSEMEKSPKLCFPGFNGCQCFEKGTQGHCRTVGGRETSWVLKWMLLSESFLSNWKWNRKLVWEHL